MGVIQAGACSQRRGETKPGSGTRRNVRSRVVDQEQAARSQKGCQTKGPSEEMLQLPSYIYAEQPAPPSGKEEPQGVTGYKNPMKQDGC